MKSTDASLESNVKISFPSCVVRCEVGRKGGQGGNKLASPPQGPQAIDYKG